MSNEISLNVTGTIIEVGRNEDDENEVVIQIAAGQNVRVSGISSDLVKRAARCLYNSVTLELTSVSVKDCARE